MNLTINGKGENLTGDGLSVSRLLVLKNVTFPQMVSVQLNGKFVKQDQYDSTILEEKDNIEFLYFMGGGR